jgi:hypothetical protein
MGSSKGSSARAHSFLCVYKRKCATSIIIQGKGKGRFFYLLPVIMKYQVMQILEELEWAVMNFKYSVSV